MILRAPCGVKPTAMTMKSNALEEKMPITAKKEILASRDLLTTMAHSVNIFAQKNVTLILNMFAQTNL